MFDPGLGSVHQHMISLCRRSCYRAILLGALKTATFLFGIRDDSSKTVFFSTAIGITKHHYPVTHLNTEISDTEVSDIVAISEKGQLNSM